MKERSVLWRKKPVLETDMSEVLASLRKLPPEQEAIRRKCFHPSGKFVEFPEEEIEQSIPERFYKIARKYPSNIAVNATDCVLTYAALNAAGNRVARAILNRCEQKEKLVALFLDHGPQAITAILGVLKTGNICVPIDPSLPPARIMSILEESRPSLIVTNESNSIEALRLHQQQTDILNLDTIDPDSSDEELGRGISPNAFSFILYTSGSTGVPKGIVQTHINVLHSIMNYTNYLHLCADDRLTLLYSFAVMGGVQDTFSALLNGASLHPLNLKSDGLSSLATWLAATRATIYHSVPTVFRHFASALIGDEKFPELRIIKLIGETLSHQDVELYKTKFSSHCVVMNCLSSTETGVMTCYFMDKSTILSGSPVPLGYAVDGKELMLLDDNGSNVASNQVGEIAVKSCYLSPGYWQRPDLTTMAFSAASNTGQRVFRTGNLGYMEPDGRLEHHGRKDFLVKLRGHRIETQEIELALLDHPGVREAAVVAYERHAQKNLGAYWVPRRYPPPAVSDLRRFLNGRLPDYMVPSVFLMLKALPLTPNGKLDRGALPEPGEKRPELSTEYTGPTQEIEKSLVSIWEEALDVWPVGIHDNFFELGGHSLTATQLIAQVIQQFQVELPLESLFQSPTVAEMATVITVHKGKMLCEEEMDRILSELESMSDEEARKLIAK